MQWANKHLTPASTIATRMPATKAPIVVDSIGAAMRQPIVPPAAAWRRSAFTR